MRLFSLGAIVVCLNCFAQVQTDPLTQGAQEFRSGQYAQATTDFRRAVDADPNNVKARLYLGTALQMQYIPGAEDATNVQFAEDALAQYQKVLELQPDNEMALASIATLYYNQKKFAESAEWNKKVIAVDPNNKEAYYTLGVLAWNTWLPVDRQARTDSHQTPDDPHPIANTQIRAALRLTWLPELDEGFQDIQHALQIDPDYSDAMAYMNLLIRYRADLDETEEQYRADIAQADEWMQKSLDTKKRAAGNASVGGTTAETGIARSARSGNFTPAGGVIGSVPATGAQSAPIRIGANVTVANLVTKVDPVYPLLARQARIAGTVRFSIIIGVDGRVENVTLVSGHPLLVQAASDAVRQYVYKPTLLNGQPVSVSSNVDVKFELDQ